MTPCGMAAAPIGELTIEVSDTADFPGSIARVSRDGVLVCEAFQTDGCVTWNTRPEGGAATRRAMMLVAIRAFQDTHGNRPATIARPDPRAT